MINFDLQPKKEFLLKKTVLYIKGILMIISRSMKCRKGIVLFGIFPNGKKINY